MTLELPTGWTAATVEELSSHEPGALTDGPFGSNLKTSHYTEAGPRVIRLQNIGDGVFHDERAHISADHFRRLRKHEATAEDIVVAMLGEKLPRACLVPAHVGPAIVKADCARLRVDGRVAAPDFVAHALNSSQVRDAAKSLVHGVGRPRLGLKWLRTLSVPLAPLQEQRRITDAIDSYLSRLDDGLATLERVQRNLQRYRASVFKAAVEGRLVPTEAELARAEGRDYEPASVLLDRILAERRRRWEEAQLATMAADGKVPGSHGWKARYAAPIQPDTSALPDLPEGWCWASVDQLEKGDRRCGYGVLVPGPDLPVGVPFVRVGDIEDGRIDVKSMKRISRAIADAFSRTYLQGGEVLITLVGTIGRTAVVPAALVGANVARAVGVMPLSEFLDAHWVEYWFRSPAVRAAMNGKAHEVARKTLNLEDVRATAVALPPRAEQARIRRAVEHAESLIGAAVSSIVGASSRCGRLRQSVLKWAFEGRLVDQDPNDEPASVLLERIRAERQAPSTTTAKPRGRRGRQQPHPHE